MINNSLCLSPAPEEYKVQSGVLCDSQRKWPLFLSTLLDKIFSLSLTQIIASLSLYIHHDTNIALTTQPVKKAQTAKISRIKNCRNQENFLCSLYQIIVRNETEVMDKKKKELLTKGSMKIEKGLHIKVRTKLH